MKVCAGNNLVPAYWLIRVVLRVWLPCAGITLVARALPELEPWLSCTGGR